MKLLGILTFACTVLLSSAQYCGPTEVVYLLDESENAARASSTNRQTAPFDLLKQAMRNILSIPAVLYAPNFRISAYGYSASSPQRTIIPQGSSPQQALNNIELIGTGTTAGSWTARGLQMITFRPTYANNLVILVSSQGSGSNTKRAEALQEYFRILSLGWRMRVIALQGINPLDLEELTALNGGQPPVTLYDRFPENPLDPKSYKELSGELQNIINSLCPIVSSTTTTTTTTTTPRQTRPTTPRVYGLCSQCLFEGGYGFDFDPLYCDTFYQCFPGSAPINKMCPEGTMWNGASCNHINADPCSTAVCDSNTRGSTYPSGRCCNKYYRCDNGELTTQICPQGQIYEESVRSCRSVGNLTLSCRETGKLLCDVDLNGPIGPVFCAGYSPDIYGDPCKYQFGQITFSVAPGTRWNQPSCSLVAADGNMCLGNNSTDRDFAGTGGPAAVCNAVFLANYNGGSKDVFSERLQKQLNVYSFLQEATLTNNGLTFTPQMSDPMLYYYFFNNREITSNTAFRIRFRLELGFGNVQLNSEYDILSNSYCAQCRETVSFTVAATSSSRHVVTATFLTTMGNTVSTSAIIEKNNANDWLELVVIFGDVSVFGKLYVISEFSNVFQAVDFNTVPKPSGSSIETNRCGFQLGRGTHNHFVGVIDEFALYEYCQNIASVLR